MFSLFHHQSPYSIEIEAVDDIFQTGKIVDGFIVGEEIHQGGMAVLKDAIHKETGQHVLLKIPRVGRDQPVENLICFETELTVMRALSSPYVPTFIKGGNMAKNPYIAMQRVQGKSLEDIIQLQKQIPIEQAIQIAANLARSIQSIHTQEVIHLDLKPDNVLVDENLQTYIIDFGLAHHNRFPDLLAEEMRKGIGSAPYIAPEQIVGLREDLRSDIYSFGVILYEILTGELPFGNPQTINGLRERFWKQPKPPRAIREEIPPWLQEITLRCLEPFAKDRYQSATHIRQLLREPEAVKLTERAKQIKPISFWGNWKNWWRIAGYDPSPILRSSIIYEQAPLMVAAVDTSKDDQAMFERMQRAAENIIRVFPEGRISCITMMQSPPTFEGSREIDSASGIYRNHLVKLQEWAAPLKLPRERISFHIFETPDPASRIIEFAQDNEAAIILIGATTQVPNALMPWRSVMTKVVEEAHCSVHVVRK
jgi:serine/threonine protein kinase